MAGIAAALDLADAGLHVYLVERRPTIGGYMALLDGRLPHQRLLHLRPGTQDVRGLQPS
ncbi:MAG: FAD-dependent oxidoreductase [Desulfobacterales bacterium]|nr:FAD-dependent oxidoreductase [Desulfobacterales bacterium]